jgi:hypothetical protein
MAEVENRRENNSKLICVRVDEIPPAKLGHTINEYDEAIDAILREPTGSTLKLSIKDKTPQQTYNGVLPRVIENNKDPNRTFNLVIAQRRPDVFLKSVPKA